MTISGIPIYLEFIKLPKVLQQKIFMNLLYIDSLTEIGGMDHSMIAKELVCVGADGASVMQGQRNVLCARMQLSASPYMLSIH